MHFEEHHQDTSILLLRRFLDCLRYCNEDMCILQSIYRYLLHIFLLYTQDCRNQDQSYHNLYSFHTKLLHESWLLHHMYSLPCYKMGKSIPCNTHMCVLLVHKYLQHHSHSLHSSHRQPHHGVVDHTVLLNTLL